MKNIVKRIVSVALMVGLIGGCGNSLTNVEQESQAIWDVRERVENALNNGDAKTLRSMFAEDPIFVICNGPIVEGHDAIEEMHVDFFRENPGFKTEFTRQHLIFPTEDVAIETVSFIDRFSGQPMRYGGDTTVYVKEGGQWKNKYIRMHTSVPDEVLAESAFDKEAEAKAVWDLRLEVQKALCNEDTDGMMELWAEDATFGQPNGNLYIGKKEIRKAHEELFEMFDDFKIEFKRLAINFPTRDVAVEDVSYVFTATGFQSQGRDTQVLVKRDGRWWIAAVCDFIPQAPETNVAK
jgi:uncharacterized protein (TIGR02246 family)